MLCFNEGTPIIMALCLLGSVLLIVGGSMWGSGDATSDATKMATGIALFAVSLFLLTLGGIGCWCNSFFCTIERKSRIARRLYGERPPLPPPLEDGDGSSSLGASDQPQTASREGDKDWLEYVGSRSSFRSFRSGRSSTRNLRSRASLRRDRVMPNQQTGEALELVKNPGPARPLPPTPSQTSQLQLTQPPQPPPPPTAAASPPPPLPPRHYQQHFQAQLQSNFQHNGSAGNHNGSVPVPVEYSTSPPVTAAASYSSKDASMSKQYYAHGTGQPVIGSNGDQLPAAQQDDDGYQQYMREHHRRQQTQLTVRPHVAISLTQSSSLGSTGIRSPPVPSQASGTGRSTVQVLSDPVVI